VSRNTSSKPWTTCPRCWGSSPLQSGGAFQERIIRAQDGLKLYFRDYGDPNHPAPPILCLSGLARNSKDFAPFAARVSADGRRVLCLDYRGRGRSAYDPDPKNYQPATYLNDARHLLCALGLHKVVVMGASLGGILGMAFGAAMPTTIVGLMMNDVGPEVDTSGFDRVRDYLKTDRPHDSWESAIADLRTIFANHAFTEDEWRAVAEGTFREGPDGRLHFDWDVRLYETLEAADKIPDLWPYFRSVRHVPVLVLRGENSDILMPETLDKMADAHPDLRAVTVPKAGHTPTLKEPASVEAIDDFLDRIDAGHR